MGKKGYEPIPDVEKAEAKSLVAAKAKYPGLNDQQVDLMQTFDDAIAGSSFSLDVPDVDPDDLMDRGEAFVNRLITPTVTAVTMVVVAYVAKGNEFMVQAFPYLNAVVIFLSTLQPIQDRFMQAVSPIFAQVRLCEDKVNGTVDEVANNVDTTVDALQLKVREVMKPMKPTLKKAKDKSAAIEKLSPGIDIPDPDIDKEFDEMQGVVRGKVETAKESLELDKYIPSYLRSASSFYWTIVFPVVVLVLLIQLAFAWLNTYMAQTSEMTRRLQDASDLSSTVDSYKHDVSSAVDSYKQEAQDTISEFRSEFDDQVGNIKPMLINIATSYAVALAQMALIALVTSPRVRSWIVNKVVQTMSDKAMDKLREQGVTTAVEDIMGKKVPRIRARVLTTIETYEKIESLVGKVSGASEVVSVASTILEQEQKPGFLGKIFGQSPDRKKKQKGQSK